CALPISFLEHAVLFDEVVDDHRLVAVYPASERGKQKLQMEGFGHPTCIGIGCTRVAFAPSAWQLPRHVEQSHHHWHATSNMRITPMDPTDLLPAKASQSARSPSSLLARGRHRCLRQPAQDRGRQPSACA